MKDLAQRTIQAIQSVIGDQPALLHTPEFHGNELQYVSECVTTGWVSSVGSFVTRFEERLCEITGAKRAIACSNGTSALFVALKLAGVNHGDEVVIPALTFVATANAVSHCGAIPILADSEHESLGIDSEKLDAWMRENTISRSGKIFNRQTGRRIAAIVPMHCFGHPSQMPNILALAEKYSLRVVEDAAESLGSTLHGQHTGTFGDVAAISFNGNKIVTTGGGGALLTNDTTLADQAKHLTTTAKLPHRWEFFHDQVGYNLRMPNLNAALGVGQLEQLDEFVTIKRDLAQQYSLAFDNVDGVSFLNEPTGARSNFWLNAILIDEDDVSLRNELLEATNDCKIMTRPAWELMSCLPMYAECPSTDLSAAVSVHSRLINLPSGISVAQRAIAGKSIKQRGIDPQGNDDQPLGRKSNR